MLGVELTPLQLPFVETPMLYTQSYLNSWMKMKKIRITREVKQMAVYVYMYMCG
jgi:hypothetical protein